MNEDGSFTYTPSEDFVGKDYFVYHVYADDEGKRESAKVKVTLKKGKTFRIKAKVVKLKKGKKLMRNKHVPKLRYLSSDKKVATVSKAGKITEAQLREIAEYKMPDLNANDVEAAMRIVAGTARNMGITIEGWEA